MPKPKGCSPFYWDKWLTRAYLRKEYKVKTLNEIADTVGCSKMTVSLYLKRYGIKSRTRSEAGILGCYELNKKRR